MAAACPASHAGCRVSMPELTIRNLAGDVLLGPELLGPMTSIDELKIRLMPKHPPPGLSVSLFLLDAEVDNLTSAVTASADAFLELTAAFPLEELSDTDRQRLLNDLERYDFDGYSEFLSRKTLLARSDKDLVLQVIRKFEQRINPRRGFLFDELQHVHGSLQADKDVVLAAVKLNGLQLEHAHHSLRADHDIVLAAVKQNARALVFASSGAYQDCEVIRAAVEARRPMGFSRWTEVNFIRLSRLLSVVPEVVRSDVGVMKAAALRDGRLFWFAVGEARKDPKVRRAATKSWLRGQLCDVWDMPEEVLAEFGLNREDPSECLRERISLTEVRTLPWKRISFRMKQFERAQDLLNPSCDRAARTLDALALEEEAHLAASGDVVVPKYPGRKLTCHQSQRRTGARGCNHHVLSRRATERRRAQDRRARRRVSYTSKFVGAEVDGF